MKTLLSSLLVLTVSSSSLVATEVALERLALKSPDGCLRVTFRLDDQRRPAFTVAYCDTPVAVGTLGVEFASSGPLGNDLKVVGTRRASRDETYTISVGKASWARDRHHELIISLEETAPPHRRLDVAFRAFDDGVAFRYLIPEQEPLAEFVLTDEQTRADLQQRLRFGEPRLRRSEYADDALRTRLGIQGLHACVCRAADGRRKTASRR